MNELLNLNEVTYIYTQINIWMSEWINRRIHVRNNEWMSEWMNEWVNDIDGGSHLKQFRELR